MVAFKPEIPKNREFHGGDLLAQTLKHLGTEVAFGLHGGHLDAFLVGAEESGIKLIDTRHETTAVQAAEGYAKVSGKVGVCFVTANSGYVWTQEIRVHQLTRSSKLLQWSARPCNSVR